MTLPDRIATPTPRQWGISSRNSFVFFVVALLSVTIIGSSSVRSQTRQEAEYRLKAVYLMNFLQFVDWPDSTFSGEDAPIVLGILGLDPFGRIMDETLQNEKVGERPIVVKRFRTLDQLDECNALFVSASEKGDLGRIFERISDSPVLTVSDIDGFEDSGGGICFYVEKNKVRFSINIRTMRFANLKVSSKLLRLARVIDPS
jgi:hypothetical protein